MNYENDDNDDVCVCACATVTEGAFFLCFVLVLYFLLLLWNFPTDTVLGHQSQTNQAATLSLPKVISPLRLLVS